MENSFSNTYLVFAADLGFLVNIAKKYKNDALLVKNLDFNSCTPSFHLLSSLALELFPKILIGYSICKRYKGDNLVSQERIRDHISSEIKEFSHNLARLYMNFPDLMRHLNIVDIYELKNGYIWDYRLKLNNGKEIQLKDVEASRYGSFARNRDVMTLCADDDLIIELLEKLEEYVEMERKETNKVLRKNSDTSE